SKDEQGLCFINQNPGGGGHIVNPYKVEVDTLNANFEWIYIYDNNCPGDATRKVKVDKTLDSWYYDLAVNAGDPPSQWGGNNANQGMFITWPCSYFYSQPIVDSVKKSVPFYKDAVKAADYLEIYNSTSSNIYIVNTINDTIGFENNNVIGNMPDATPIVPFSGSSQIPIGYMIPSSGQYNIKMSSFGNPLSSLSVYDNYSSYSYIRANATIAQTDLFAFTTNGFEISNTDNITKQISIEAINDFNNEEKTFDITNLGLAQNSNITFSILANDKLKIVNQGVASFYDVEIKYTSSSGLGAFSYSPISIDANTTHIIATNWASIQSQDVAIYVDNGNNGTNEDTIYFNNLQTPQVLTYPTFFSKSSASSADTIYIANTGGGTMNWTAASGNPSWLTITSGAGGTGNDTIFISCSANSGAARTSQITINAAGASNSPYIIAVNQEGVMTAPVNVVASDGNFSDGIHVSWDASSGATHYMVYRSNDAVSDGTDITGWISVTLYIDTTASNGLFYYYSVKAAQDVSGLNATGFSTKDDGWRSCFTADFTYISTCTGQATTFTDNSAAHTFAYYLWDINNDGSVEYTGNTINHTYTSAGTYTVNLTVTDSSLCTSTKQKSVTVLSFPAITLPDDTTLCPDQSITIDAGAGFNSYLWSTGATASGITVDSTGYGMGSYHFYVQVSNANGCSAIDTIIVTWSPCTEIESVSNGFAMNIYPNPTNNTVNIAVSGLSSDADMKIFNISGQLIFSENIENTASKWSRSYNFTGMSKGVYFVRLVSRDVVKVEKIIVY
ncbi:MAG: T9SS type A sorting domain-containing protein, partial [Bacteroidales bacterium]